MNKTFNTNKYKTDILSSIEAKKEWFKDLYIHFMKSDLKKELAFKDEQELLTFLDNNKIDKKEFELYKDDFIAYSIKCKMICPNFLIDENFDDDEDSRTIYDITCDEDMTNEELTC